MGSTSSRLSSRRSPDRFKFSSLVCGGSSSQTTLEMEDSPAEVLINSSEHCELVNNDRYLIPESSSNHRMGPTLSGLNISSRTTCEHSSNRASAENHVDDPNQVTANNNNDSASISHSANLPDTLRDGFIEAVPSGLGFLVNREQNQGDESLLQVDVVSISPNVFSSSGTNHETRTNSRQIFRDAFSRRNSGRQLDSPTIVFSTGDRNDRESSDRWVLDFGDDFFDDVLGRDYGYIGSRLNRLHERRRHSRSLIWDSSRGDRDENIRRTARCPTGLHPEGSCSCESFLVRGDSSGRSSISRIVMLAETLFEVLDEIHRQPVSLSLSIPAPESVVDSFPLKDHKKKDYALDGDDFAQCHICLAEYEEGDKIRVLPCHHEYHKSCVDKWLKEIHGVCPLCRGDVRQGDSQRSAPEQEIHSA